MSLLVTSKHSRRDLAAFAEIEREASAIRKTSRWRGRVAKAQDTIAEFVAGGPAYLGVSWGKDSVTVAHLTIGIARVPMFWIKELPNFNPECELVRDLFLARFDVDYSEIYDWDTGFKQAAQRCGADRHISGVRAEESRVRRLTVRRNREISKGSCRPLAYWTAVDVFAYLLEHDLPIHPAYGYTMDGLLDVKRLRVDCLGDDPGRGHGRAEWEHRYYREAMANVRMEKV